MTAAPQPQANDQVPGASAVRNARGAFRLVPVLSAAAAFLFVAAYSLWYTSSGHFPAFPDIRNDYIELGESFLKGQLFLEEQPDPRLAELGNPYDYSQRKGIRYHWDASYFAGRYYLYWGPVPGMVAAALHAVGGSPSSASLLVTLPYLGLMAVAALLLWQISRSFGRYAQQTVWLFILIGFFNLPMLFTIGQPRHYQASILYGQLFLLGGVLAAVLYTRGLSCAWLPVAGVLWGLAFASRYNLALAVAVYMLLTVYWLWRQRLGSDFWVNVGLLVGGLTLVLLALGLYNYARFGDPLETGLSYQLTIPEFGKIDYSRAYVPSGLYIYLLYPLTGAPAFPFIQSAHFTPRLLPEWLYVPAGRQFDQIAFGLLPTVPVLWMFLVAVPIVPALFARRRSSQPTSVDGVGPGPLFLMLAAGVVVQFVFLLVFFYVAERYIVDFFVPLVLCLAIVIWTVHQALQGAPILRVALWVLTGVLALWTMAIGYFACFGVPVLVSLYYDPAMLARQAAFWNTVLAPLRSLLMGV